MRILLIPVLTGVSIFAVLTTLDAFHLLPTGLAHYLVLGGVALICSVLSQLVAALFPRKAPAKSS